MQSVCHLYFHCASAEILHFITPFLSSVQALLRNAVLAGEMSFRPEQQHSWREREGLSLFRYSSCMPHYHGRGDKAHSQAISFHSANTLLFRPYYFLRFLWKTAFLRCLLCVPNLAFFTVQPRGTSGLENPSTSDTGSPRVTRVKTHVHVFRSLSSGIRHALAFP